MKMRSKEHSYSQDNRYPAPGPISGGMVSKEFKASQDGRSGKHAANMKASMKSATGQALSKFK
jgi:hypothetical protein